MRKKKLYQAMALALSALLVGTAACGQKTNANSDPIVQEGNDGADKSQSGSTGNEEKEKDNQEKDDPGNKDKGNGENQGTDGAAAPNQPQAGGEEKENGSDKTGSDGTVVTPGNNANAEVKVDAAISAGLAGMIEAVKKATPQTKESKASITLSDAGIEVNGNGCKVDGSTIKIKESGTYTVSGSLSNGMIFVNPDDEGEVVLVLNGISVHNETGASIYCKKASKVTVVLADGTENMLSGGSSYVYDEGETEPDAVFFAKHDLVITGTGKLNIKANYKDGLKGKDALYLLGGSITVSAADDGIVGRDLLYVAGGSYTVEAKGDAMKSTNDKDAALGMIVIDGGSFVLTSEEDAIQAENTLFIQDGTFEIKTGKGADGAQKKTGRNEFGGGFPRREVNRQAQETGTEEASVKGLKAASIVVYGGSFAMDTESDAVHGNDKVYILGGNFRVDTGDDALHADNELTIAGSPVITVARCYEGLEAKDITVNGGTIDITASDDGVNAAGGADQSGFGGRGMIFAAGSGQFTMNGGILTVNADGDGLDSNGSITMNGGTVVVYGPVSDGDGALDYDGSFALNGGSLLSLGSSGMAQAASATSAQYSLAAALSQRAEAGSTVEVKIDGKTIFKTVSAKPFSYIVASSADFTKDAKTEVLINGVESFAGALTSVVTSFGNPVGGFGFGGMGKFPDGNLPDGGGMPGRGDRPNKGERPDGGNRADGDVPEGGGFSEGEFPNGGSFPNGFPDGAFPDGNFPNMGGFPDGEGFPGMNFPDMGGFPGMDNFPDGVFPDGGGFPNMGGFPDVEGFLDDGWNPQGTADNGIS